MNQTLYWVLGQGGLLGSSLTRAIPRRISSAALWPCKISAFSWQDPPRLAEQFSIAVQDFFKAVTPAYDSWVIYWAAGGGIVDTSEEDLLGETRTWDCFLRILGSYLDDHSPHIPGLIFLASSAGGVYGGSADHILTEDSERKPISAYGRFKMGQEDILCQWAIQHRDISFLIGRLSNLYGTNQKPSKRQGLISHLCRCSIYRQPAHIYVSLDTIRDYIFADDCADYIVLCISEMMREIQASKAALCLIKIFASGRTYSIAQIVEMISRMAKHHPKVIIVPTLTARRQPKRLRFRSVVLKNIDIPHRTDLLVGINRIYQYQLALLKQGALSIPHAPAFAESKKATSGF